MFSNHTYQVYYKVRQLILLQSATAVLLQSAATVITKRDRYYKVRQNTVLSKVIFFSSQVFGFILVLGTRLAEFILETNYLSRRIIRRTDNSIRLLARLEDVLTDESASDEFCSILGRIIRLRRIIRR